MDNDWKLYNQVILSSTMKASSYQAVVAQYHVESSEDDGEDHAAHEHEGLMNYHQVIAIASSIFQMFCTTLQIFWLYSVQLLAVLRFPL